jgi:alkylation response protein AidB-like acyl-CoA dehydrogenase
MEDMGIWSALASRKIVRDLRVHQILEGTNEVMSIIIAQSLFAERDQ